METKFEIATTKNFNGITLNCYCEEGQENSGEFWATREQIGQLLGYEKPNKAVANIHDRNANRLNKFSTTLKMRKVEGNRTVTRDVTVYNFKGLLEICRYSNQPNAHKVIDVLWEIADEIRKHGMFVTTQALRKLEERVAMLENELVNTYPVRILGEIVLARPECITVQNAAQFLRQHGVETGQNRLFQYCRDRKLLCSRKGRQRNQPTQRAIEQGLFNLEVRGGFKATPMVTPKGLQVLAEDLASEQFPLLIAIEE